MDVAEIQEAVTNELKKFQKEQFLAAFQKLYNHTKACKYANGVYFDLKIGMCLRIKKIILKTFVPHCIYL